MSLNLTMNPPPRLTLKQSNSSTVILRQPTAQASVIVRGPGRGPAGPMGVSPTVVIGQVQTGPSGGTASVSNSGTLTDLVLDFVLPTGPVGPQGPIGPQGLPGAPAYVHTQSSPSNVWTINHNLGYRPTVELLTVGGVEFDAEVVHASGNQTLVYLTTPTAGTARLI